MPLACLWGINCRFPADAYRPGAPVCWPSFSSASYLRTVAEEFAKGEEGSLFFLQSRNASQELSNEAFLTKTRPFLYVPCGAISSVSWEF